MRIFVALFIALQVLCLNVFAQQEPPKIEISNQKVIVEGKKFYIHNVKSGETLYSLARAYKVDKKEIMIHNPQLSEGLKAGSVIKIPIQSLSEEQAGSEISDTTGFHYIKIRRKHTLFSLSQEYSVSIQEIYDANPGLAERGLKRKETIKIPKHQLVSDKVDFTKPTASANDSLQFIYHTVKKGETLYSLSKKYKIERDTITDANPDLLDRGLRFGEVIKIPKKNISFVVNFPGNNMQVLTFPKPEETETTTTTITSPDIEGSDDSFNLNNAITDNVDVMLLLPFSANSNLDYLQSQKKNNTDLQLYPVSQMMVQFYEGFLTGLSMLELHGKTVNLRVYDSEMKPEVVRQILNRQVKTPDFIVGPAHSKNIEICLQYGQEHSVPVVTPVELGNSSDLPYSNLISLNTTQNLRHEILAKWLYQRNDNIVIVHDGQSSSLQEANQLKNNITDFLTMKEVEDNYNIKLFSLTTKNQSSLKALMSRQKANSVIAVGDDKVFINTLMNTLYQCSKSDIRLFGQKSWLNYHNISAEEFKTLKFSFISPIYLDYNDTLSYDFINKYREKFLDEPDYYSFMGYDVARLMITSAFCFNKNLQTGLLAQSHIKGLAMDFRFMQNHSTMPLQNTGVMLIGLTSDYELKPFFKNQ